MTDQEAYDELNQERPVIIFVLEIRSSKHKTAESLADFVTNHDDSPELKELISQAARVVFAKEVAK